MLLTNFHNSTESAIWIFAGALNRPRWDIRKSENSRLTSNSIRIPKIKGCFRIQAYVIQQQVPISLIPNDGANPESIKKMQTRKWIFATVNAAARDQCYEIKVIKLGQ
jgi:hypothetical protein